MITVEISIDDKGQVTVGALPQPKSGDRSPMFRKHTSVKNLDEALERAREILEHDPKGEAEFQEGFESDEREPS